MFRQLIARIILILVFTWLVGCSTPTKTQIVPTVTDTVTIVLPSPVVRTTRIPDVEQAALVFLEGWKNETYTDMYGVLTLQSQKNVTQDKFTQLYQSVSDEAALSNLDYQILSSEIKESDLAEVKYRVVLHSFMVGDLTREISMPLMLEEGQWRVNWDQTLIMPELIEGRKLRMDFEIPPRAGIFDSDGKPLAIDADAIAVGLYADYVRPDIPEGLVGLLSQFSGLGAETIINRIENAPPGGYLALGQVLAGEYPYLLNALSGYGAVVVGNYHGRFYPRDGIGPHLVGYVSAIQKEELSSYRRQGYRSDESIGRKGLEKWGEQILSGKNGGALYVVDEKETPVVQLGTTESQPGQDITTTIETDFQWGVQKAIQGFRGAIVVLERDTGKVLALASTPGFDQNGFQTANVNWSALLGDITSNPDMPQFNRATQGQYPLGSVFKVVTISAALNSGRFTPESTYNCGYDFIEVPGLILHDWTYDHFLQDGFTKPSGMLSLPQGLIRSCNPYFWYMGLDLYNAGLARAVSDMARGFGLGSFTGLEGLDEEAGKIPDPGNPVDAVNLAIGQGDTQVTVLQVADFMAAIGNGGTLYRPQMIERIGSKDSPTFVFTPAVRGTLPLNKELLKVVQDAMRGVVISKTPRGTAYDTFAGFSIPVAGKTGTATAGPGLLPHAWFAGYTMAENKDRPDIAIAVLIENIGEGSDYAAPIFRRVVEYYFNGHPQRLYRWEAAINVTKTPTPLVTETPTPEP